MQADLTRNTFDQRKQFSRVLMQQGRVQLDSDWNEQMDILLHYIQTLAADIFGLDGGPEDNAGFEIIKDINRLPEEERMRLGSLDDGDFVIGKGRYYVDGVLCENQSYVKYTNQPDLPSQDPPGDKRYLVYLDVWERHITAIEVPSIREVALGGPDTATRAKVVWQARVASIPAEFEDKEGSDAKFTLDRESVWANWREGRLQMRQPANRGMLKAKAKDDPDDGTDPSNISPEARYRGFENQLYRVEIHDGGEPYGAPRSPESITDVQNVASPKQVKVADNGQDWQADQWVELFNSDSNAPGTLRRITAVDEAERTLTLNEDIPSGTPQPNRLRPVATFKWSRDNGSVTFPIRGLGGSVVTLESLGRDDHLSLKVGDLVEIVDDEYVLQGRAEPLLRVKKIDATTMIDVTTMRVTLDGQPPADVGRDSTKHPLLRRWDHGSSASQNGSSSYGTIPLKEGTWLPLEDGIEIYFQSAPEQGGDVQREQNVYRTGDYWLIPARTATGDVEWPGDVGQPEAQPPHGTDHHYAPLAIIDNGSVTDCRRHFKFRDLERRVGDLERTVGGLRREVDDLKNGVRSLEGRVGAMERIRRLEKVLLGLDVAIIVLLIVALILLLV